MPEFERQRRSLLSAQGLFQPWDNRSKTEPTLKALANGCAVFANAFSVETSAFVGSYGCRKLQPWAESRKRLRRSNHGTTFKLGHCLAKTFGVQLRHY